MKVIQNFQIWFWTIKFAACLKGPQIPSTVIYLEQIGGNWYARHDFLRYGVCWISKLYVINFLAPANQIRVILLPIPDPLLGSNYRRPLSYGEACCW